MTSDVMNGILWAVFPGSDYLIIHLIKFDNMCYPLFLDSLSGNSGTSTLIDDGPFAKMVIFRRC